MSNLDNDPARTSGLPWKSSALFFWKNLTIHCGSPSCSVRPKVRFAALAHFRGIHFQRAWYHQAACLNEALTAAVQRIISNPIPVHRRGHRLPIGLLLVRRGVISPEQLRQGLHLQRVAGTGKLGYWLRQITRLEEDQICAALSQQWGCPVFPLDSKSAAPITPDAPPYLLFAAAKAFPVFATSDGRCRHIAFADHIDHSLLYALEQLLGCHTIPCVARESAINDALEQLRKRFAGTEICFDTVHEAGEIASIICSYAAQMDVRELKIARGAGYLWAAFFRKEVRRDLLFRLPSAASQPSLSANSQIKVFPEIAEAAEEGVRAPVNGHDAIS